MRWIFSVFSLSLASCLTACGGGGSSTAEFAPAVSSGLYAAAQYSSTSVALSPNLVYSTRPNPTGLQYTSDRSQLTEVGSSELALTLDVWVPPNASSTALQPLVMLFHGGGFFQGAKEDISDRALSYAQAGYVAASVNYRLTPDNEANPALRILAITHAMEDAMNAIRYLKVNAATFHIDSTRIATIGISAGGGISLNNAVEYDTLVGTVSDYPGVSSRVNAAVSTGATLIESGYNSDDFLHYDATDTPVMLFHANTTDSATGATWLANVIPTQERINASGNTCTTVSQPNLSHTVNLGVGGPYWSVLQPFLWAELNLTPLL